MKVVANAMESDRFGVRFARLEDPTAALDLAATMRQADANGIEIVSVRVDSSDLALVRALEDVGFRLMDTLVYHRRSLPFEGPADDPAILPLGPDDADAVAAIALASFHGYLGHYHADPRLSDDAADAAYADWARRLLSDPALGQIALGAKRGGALTAFIVGRPLSAGSSDIVLNAVHPQKQRDGTYTALLRAYLAGASARGDGEVQISTQLQNHTVQRVWSRAGFTLFASYHTLHRWAPAT